MTDLPANVEAEIALLGAILIDNDTMSKVSDKVRPADMHSKSNAILFEAMQDMWRDQKAIDPLTLVNHLKAKGELEKSGGVPAISLLIDAVPTAEHAPEHARIVREAADRRRIIKAANDVISSAYNDEYSVLTGTADDLISAMGGQPEGGFKLIKESVWGAMEDLENIVEGKEGSRGLLTGFYDLDRMLVGFDPGDLIVVAGRPSMGKTAFVLNVAANLSISDSVPVGIVSLEMDNQALALRLIASEARVDLQKMRNGSDSKDAYKRLASAATNVHGAPIYIDDNPVATLPELAAKVTKLVRSEGVRMVIIDYLQLMESSEDGRVDQISKITRGLKLLAGRLKVPIVVLSQLSRKVEERKDKRPMMSDLRESGSIEQDADVVMFLYRPEYYASNDEQRLALKGLAEVIISKQRNGPTGSCPLYFHDWCARFDSKERRYGDGQAA